MEYSVLADVEVLATVVKAGGFREAARASGKSSSGLSSAVRRLEGKLGVRLLYRTTRNVRPTEQGQRLLERIAPLLIEAAAALTEAKGTAGRLKGSLRINVPVSAARLILPKVIPAFHASYPDIEIEVIAQSGFVDVLAGGFDAGIRYGDSIPRDMVAVPFGPRSQRFATAASPAYLRQAGVPQYPDELRRHSCLRERTEIGRIPSWHFERDGHVIVVEPKGPLITGMGGAADLAVSSAISGLGVLHLFEEWVRPYFASGVLVPILEPWWQRFDGPYLYFSGGPLLPPPVRAFVDFIKSLTYEDV